MVDFGMLRQSREADLVQYGKHGAISFASSCGSADEDVFSRVHSRVTDSALYAIQRSHAPAVDQIYECLSDEP